MCGRSPLYNSVEQLRKHFPFDLVESEITPNYNVVPSQKVPAIIHREGNNVLDNLHAGPCPSGQRAPRSGSKMINARQETVSIKPAFRDVFKKRRCLIPADGFYEWYGKKGQKQPVLIALPGGKFAFAGLWETLQDNAEPSNEYSSCTIITRDQMVR